MATTDVDVNKIKNNFLAAYHILKFSKADKDDTEIVDIERRCLAIKYLTAKQFESEDVAAYLLQRNLEDYQDLMEKRDGVNNYWKQVRLQISKTTNNPQKWKSGLCNVDTALNFVKPLPCQDNNTMPCHRRVFSNRHIENIINIWKNKETAVRNRKVSTPATPKLSPGPSINSKGKLEDNILHEVGTSSLSSTRSVDENLSVQVSYSKLQRAKSYPVNQKSQSPVQQRPVKFEPKSYTKFSKEESFKKFKNNHEPSNFYKNNAKSKSQVSVQQNEEDSDTKNKLNSFKTARDELSVQQIKANRPMQKKTLGGKASINSQFVCPFKREKEKAQQGQGNMYNNETDTMDIEDERLKNIEPKMVELIKNEIMDSKTSLTSKWIGEGEKMVRALFAVARVYQPSVIFVDEIDSLLTQRSETEHESSRRLKTEFLVQLDGAATAEEDRILIVGATNRPQELDEAARRRLVKRLYVPLPEFQARKQIVNNLLITIPHNLSEEEVNNIAEQSQGYSGADMSNLCKEASMGPIRSIPFSQLEDIRKEDVRQVTLDDFKEALIHMRPSVSESSLTAYAEWDAIYGTGTAHNYKV
ncbi:Fidgetin-like protein 1 [Habropoda laboriosa]|uniref:Fidgetin-like protein 1 n=1 Tax=Habropoda laboriosa TaxID=597456 RepID=A0A0L7QQJ2_9HYME|nr:Fidgetin-like protein 1 [Habropoda laboriosa]